jgi:hypothetical protein
MSLENFQWVVHNEIAIFHKSMGQIMNRESDTDSGRVSDPRGDVRELEFGKFQKLMRLVGRRGLIF